ncbi:MAG: cob(I)yrinic acid a,c-diamide adenosyltransferase [Planctomycetaceae bacterium]|nr:cob(I)yrinic acid a,c-diamide adenosyltransferase [Planctomycetaceae bacterium]
MVYLNKIYTREGDAGHTSLGNGERVPKTHPRIIAYGGTDELNAVLGLLISSGLPGVWMERIKHIQNDLFDLSADLCIPESDEEPGEHPPLRVSESQVHKIEEWIDECNESLEPLTSFILPGGSPMSAWMHLARTVCRRVEIDILKLSEQEPVNRCVPAYLNRLSDLLFVLGRHFNEDGKADILWEPGKNHPGDAPPRRNATT